MKRIAIAVVLAVLLMLVMPVAVSAAGVTVVDRIGDGEWTNNTWQVEIYPGESKSTTISLYNSSSSSLEVEVSISPRSLDNGNLTFELHKAKFTMPRRSYIDVTLSVRANSSTTPGTYTAELEIKSEVPPKDGVTPTPTPPVSEEEPEEPTEPEEPEEPEVVEPEEPEVVEPEEEEPEVVEPEEEEPEVVEPEEEEEPYEPEKPGIPWGLIGGVVGGLAAAGGIGYWLWRRRRNKDHA
ncbi:hypothetical protein ES705_37905 [subsurface metagenome]